MRRQSKAGPRGRGTRERARLHSWHAKTPFAKRGRALTEEDSEQGMKCLLARARKQRKAEDRAEDIHTRLPRLPSPGDPLAPLGESTKQPAYTHCCLPPVRLPSGLGAGSLDRFKSRRHHAAAEPVQAPAYSRRQKCARAVILFGSFRMLPRLVPAPPGLHAQVFLPCLLLICRHARRRRQLARGPRTGLTLFPASMDCNP